MLKRHPGCRRRLLTEDRSVQVQDKDATFSLLPSASGFGNDCTVDAAIDLTRTLRCSSHTPRRRRRSRRSRQASRRGICAEISLEFRIFLTSFVVERASRASLHHCLQHYFLYPQASDA